MILVEEMNPRAAESRFRIEERVGLDGKPVNRLIIEGYAMITSKGTAMTFSEVKEVKSRRTVMID